MNSRSVKILFVQYIPIKYFGFIDVSLTACCIEIIFINLSWFADANLSGSQIENTINDEKSVHDQGKLQLNSRKITLFHPKISVNDNIIVITQWLRNQVGYDINTKERFQYATPDEDLVILVY